MPSLAFPPSTTIPSLLPGPALSTRRLLPLPAAIVASRCQQCIRLLSFTPYAAAAAIFISQEHLPEVDRPTTLCNAVQPYAW